MIERGHEVLASIARIPKVFIAQVEGHALGGGLEISLACDLRFGARGSYKLGVPEVTLGLLPGNGGTQRLPRIIGVPKALDLMITGRPISPGEAHGLGILNRLFAAARGAEKTRAYAEALAGGATVAIGEIKAATYAGVEMPIADAPRPRARGHRAPVRDRRTPPRASRPSPKSASRSSKVPEVDRVRHRRRRRRGVRRRAARCARRAPTARSSSSRATPTRRMTAPRCPRASSAARSRARTCCSAAPTGSPRTTSTCSCAPAR